MNAIYLGILWMAYYAMHSALATDGIKRFFAKNLPVLSSSYRLLFSVLAILNFGLLLWFHRLVPSKNIFASGTEAYIAALLLALLSLCIIAVALRNYEWRFWFFSTPKQAKLITTGINGLVRHPLYFGIIIGLLALVLAFPSWKNIVFAIITLIYIVIGSLLEEQKLLRAFGQDYQQYREQVRMLVPWVV